MANEKFEWTEFYTTLADTLAQYVDHRSELVRKILYVYETIGMKLPTLEKDSPPKEMDPFTIYALFNKGISNNNRIKLLEGIASEFGIRTTVPKTFDGVPILNNRRATFYYFEGNRAPEDIDQLWEIFIAALQLSADDNTTNRSAFSNAYEKVIKQRGIAWNITIGLFWIRPNFFLNLDGRNRWFLGEERVIPTPFATKIQELKGVPDANRYLELIDECKEILQSGNYPYTTFPELSYTAWVQSEKVNAEKKSAKVNNGASGIIDNTRTVHYWIYAPGENACYWDLFHEKGMMAIGWGDIGDLKTIPTKASMNEKMKEARGAHKEYTNDALATWQFANEIKIGDIIFVKKGKSQIVGRGVVTGEYQFDSNPVTDNYNNVREVDWTNNGVWNNPCQAINKTLTDISSDTGRIQELEALFESDPPVGPVPPPYPPYTKEDFLEDVYLTDQAYEELIGLIRYKKNVIIQGAPGVGKTYIAKRLAYSIMGRQDRSRVEIVQFHQSYSYEDFIMGYRPNGTGFELHKGPFYEFCKKAEDDNENDYFFIIDEINRGNLSKIFGELFMLIENDKRGLGLNLLYANEQFNVPKNLYLIGLMNTADRSLAMLDYALRRRFAFFEIEPAFTTEGFVSYQETLDNDKFNALIEIVRSLNDEIAEDESLGEGCRIGHSFFCNLESETLSDAVLSSIIEYELIPLLKEYWFDEPSKVKQWTDRLRGVLK